MCAQQRFWFRSLIRIFTRHILVRQRSQVSSSDNENSDQTARIRRLISVFVITKTRLSNILKILRSKKENFQIKKKNSDIFHILTQNIDCGYSLEAVLTGTHNLCFWAEIRKNNVYRCKPQFYYIKCGLRGSKLYRHVFVMLGAHVRWYDFSHSDPYRFIKVTNPVFEHWELCMRRSDCTQLQSGPGICSFPRHYLGILN